MTIVEIKGVGGSDLRCDYRPLEGDDLDQRAVLIVDTASGRAGFVERTANRLSEAGLAVLILDATDAEARGDRVALADIERVLSWLGERDELDSRSIAVVGADHGGTLAFLVGCTSRQVAAVASIGGPVEYAALSEARPAQPIELHLNLDRPFLLVERAPGGEPVPADQLERLSVRLEAGHKSYVCVPEDADGRELVRFLDETL